MTFNRKYVLQTSSRHGAETVWAYGGLSSTLVCKRLGASPPYLDAYNPSLNVISMQYDFLDVLGSAFRRSQKCVPVLKCHQLRGLSPLAPGALPLDPSRGLHPKAPRSPYGGYVCPVIIFWCRHWTKNRGNLRAGLWGMDDMNLFAVLKLLYSSISYSGSLNKSGQDRTDTY